MAENDEIVSLRERVRTLEMLLATSNYYTWPDLFFPYSPDYQDILLSGNLKEAELSYFLSRMAKDRISAFRLQSPHFRDRIGELEARVTAQQKTASESRRETHSYLALLSMGIDLADAPLSRFLPVRTYLGKDDPSAIDAITQAIYQLADTFGFEVSDEFPSESGSWFKKFFVKTKEAATSKEVTDRLTKLERALELQGLDKPQAEVDKAKAEAIANLSKAVEGQKQAVIQCGSILLVKTTNAAGECMMQVRTLTHLELAHLERNQNLLKCPETVLDKLAELTLEHEMSKFFFPPPIEPPPNRPLLEK